MLVRMIDVLRRIILAGLILSTLAALPALAEPRSAGLSDLRPNRWIRVETRDAARIEGAFIRAGADSLTLRADSTMVTVAMLSIGSVHERRGSAGRGALIGAIAGAAAGAAGGIAWSGSDSWIKPSSPAAGAAVVGVIGGAFGTGLGALVGAMVPHWRLRYRAAP